MSERIPEWLSGELDGARLEELRAHLATCTGCADEATALERLWRELGEPAAVPGPALRQRFDALLSRERAKSGATILAFGARAGAAARRRIAPALQRLAAVAALLALGVLVGTELSRRRDDAAIAELKSEVHSLHETVALALLAEPSPSERLKGVSYGRTVSGADDSVAAALFQTMLNDSNVNVRLAALDALRSRAQRPSDRPRLVAAVAEQDSPLVQLSLINVLLESDREAARRDLAQLLGNPKLDPVVRGYLRDRLGRSL
jgi:hypothetical protein